MARSRRLGTSALGRVTDPGHTARTGSQAELLLLLGVAAGAVELQLRLRERLPGTLHRSSRRRPVCNVPRDSERAQRSDYLECAVAIGPAPGFRLSQGDLVSGVGVSSRQQVVPTRSLPLLRLVECQLDTDGKVRLEEVASAVVAGPRRGETPARVFVVTESAVTQFAQAILELTTRAHEQAQFHQ